jgi:putrescine transport system permease protein
VSVEATTARAPAAEASARPRRRFDLTNLALTVWGVLVYVFLFLPIAMIVIFSFNNGRALLAWEGFGTDAYRTLPDNDVIVNDITTSLKAAIGAALIATILGALAGIALARRPGKWTIVFMAMVFLVLVTPEIVDAISLLIWYVRIKGPFGPSNTVVNYGLARLWVGHSLFATAVVTLIVRARLAGLDESLEEAAADLYASPTRAFRQITLPLMMPAVLAGALLAFSLSLDNTIISTFVSVAGATPWPVYVFSAVRSILRPEIAAASTLLLLLTLFALGIVALVLRRSGDSAEEVARTIAGTG